MIREQRTLHSNCFQATIFHSKTHFNLQPTNANQNELKQNKTPQQQRFETMNS